MNPSKDKFVLGVASIVIFLVSFYLIVFFLSQIRAHPVLYLNLAVIFIVGLNAAILLSWLSFGLVGGLPSLLLAGFLLLPAHLKIGAEYAGAFAATFLISSFIGSEFLRQRANTEQAYGLKAERMQEEVNLLANEINGKEQEIDALKKKFKRYAILKNVAEDLGTTLSLEEVMKIIVERSLHVISTSERCHFFLVDEAKQELALRRTRGSGNLARVKSKQGDVFDKHVFKQRRSLIIDDVEKDFRFSQDAREKEQNAFRSLISSPLVSRHKVIGVLRQDSRRQSSYTQEDLRLLDFIADLSSVAIENCFLYQRTEELAIKDGLTGLAVHRYFRDRLAHEVKRSARTEAAFSLLMADIDNFKEYNDHFGHISGDVVLKHLAKILTGATREGDLVSRYGGEEFAVILLGKNKQQAIREAEVIRKRIEEESVTLRRKKLRLTISIGVASYPRDALLDEELIKKADSRLYRAKEKGKNRVCG